MQKVKEKISPYQPGAILTTQSAHREYVRCWDGSLRRKDKLDAMTPERRAWVVYRQRLRKEGQVSPPGSTKPAVGDTGGSIARAAQQPSRTPEG